MTGLVVIITGYWNSGLQGSELTLTAFESGMGSVARALIAISIFLFGLTTSTAVSYTHLDVYKRQRPISSVCPVILSDMVITPLIGKIWMKICLF